MLCPNVSGGHLKFLHLTLTDTRCRLLQPIVSGESDLTGRTPLSRAAKLFRKSGATSVTQLCGRQKFELRYQCMKYIALLSVLCALVCVDGCATEHAATKSRSGATAPTLQVNNTTAISTAKGSSTAAAAGLQCKRSRVTGTLIDVRVCTTAAQREATAADTQATQDALRGPHSGRCVGLDCSN